MNWLKSRQELKVLARSGTIVAVLLMAVSASQLLPRQSRGRQVGVPGYDYVKGRTLGEVPDAELVRHPSETDDIAYANRVALAVHSSSYNCEPGNFSLTPIERVISGALAQFRLIDGKLIWSEGLLEKHALICGFCGQRAVIASEILRKNGINAWAFGVGGHVLVKFAAGGHEYLVDPDYGISAYRYDVRRGILRGEIVTKYTKAGWTNASQIYGYVSSRADNEDYLNPEYASHIEAMQESVFYYANSIAIGLILLAPCVAFGVRSKSPRST
ncbi:hypothetical protein JQ616_16195 [Bradyrhizobium tropiciagri]|uniref:hypothetical protein n=1 Tax=Bradyrhizobium tropiciagri TaxID=312253 RepID=UPI001BA6C86D|nr:hypothetical protein [Bradyrhizobium tropiciagri]MBR0896503.1 hypothetical protein [Bradyrhizobium tropiciagri]